MIIRINKATDATDEGIRLFTEISKPPKALVDVKPESYRPQILTIGPLHEMLSGNPVLCDVKASCVNKFMKAHDISDVEELMKRLFYDPSDLHNHYSGLPNYSSESFQLLVTVDTIVIRELLVFILTPWDSILDEHTQFCKICNNNITYKQAVRDLFLMGNQIPMSYLKKLIEEFPNPPNLEMDEIQKVVADVVKRIDPFPIRNSQHKSFGTPNFLHCSHLLDWLYVWVIRKPLEENRRKAIEQRADPIPSDLPSASQLYKAGIRFRAIEGSISVMKYDKRKRRFDLPQLVVQDNTEDLLRNFLAYEETLINTGHEFSLYVVTMDSLIKTQEDLEILSKAFVIQSELGSSERLLQMWSAMAKNVVIQPSKDGTR
mgnify:CR=1 FL=1